MIRNRKTRRVPAVPALAVLLLLALASWIGTNTSVKAQTGIAPPGTNTAPVEAPTGFDNQTNGLVDQATHDADRGDFLEEVDSDASGLGPVFNETSCVHCHLNPNSGGGSTVTEIRVGHLNSAGHFVNPTVPINGGASVISGRSLINRFSICPQAQESVPGTENIQTLRMSVNTLGDGFVEAISDGTLLAIARSQRIQTNGFIHGQAISVPVLEAPGKTRIGRFGWKDQQATLLSFAADAYLNEQGITNRLLPQDVTSVCDAVADPEDPTASDGTADIDHFAEFMRATKAPPVDQAISAQPDAQAGSAVFDRIGCGTCHVRTIVTAPAGTVVNGGAFQVPPALASKIIHPFSDFLLHDVGTGDGIVQNGGQNSANKLRTPPLWGLRVRAQLMHDGRSLTPVAAISQHSGEASGVIRNYNRLSPRQKQQLATFLSSL